MKPLRIAVVVLVSATLALAASQEVREKVAKGRRQMLQGRPDKAEKTFRDAIRLDSSFAEARMLLGDALMAQRRHSPAAEEYQKARTLELNAPQLSKDDQRKVWNQLGVAYAQSAKYDKAKEILREAIQRDPDYFGFHYNLACAYAEAGDLKGAIPHLRAAWERRKNTIPGQRFPDPRADNSFAPYLKDERFQDAVRDMVF